MTKNQLRIVFDTNVIMSSIIFGGKPKKIIRLVIEGKIVPFISQSLQAELSEVLIKKFQFTTGKLKLLEEFIEENFKIVYPSISLDIVSDKDDNRVLETAVEGKCQYIITGDNDLLNLNSYKEIKTLSPDKSLNIFKN